MKQEIAYIKLREIVSRITCSGWEFRPCRADSPDFVFVKFVHPTIDTYDGDEAVLRGGVHISCADVLNVPVEGTIRLIYERILSLTIHEFQENFKVDGKIVLNPHLHIEEKSWQT